ncbi:nucleotidyltransferase domain-containing protein [Yinghuangia seranimata]|nr:nucleotidyltransferase domain-containing protein [Yinghuangia seranimata]MDI2127779.1 nucleotidyltransferase domain-containing protein [Yinghuangia seranimata]
MQVDLARLADLTTGRPDQPDPLAFATVSGAHLYGFPSRDSDVDLRGVHVLPPRDLVGLREGEQTRTRMWDEDGVEYDLVTHDLGKFARLLLRRNGYVLEQLLSPLVVRTSDTHAELVALTPRLLTRHHAHHYAGFARTQTRLFDRTGELKPLLYTFRVLLTGIHLMRTGAVVADLPQLAASHPADAPPYLADLIAAKRDAEHGALDALVTPETAHADLTRLNATLDDAHHASRLPDQPDAFDALHDLVVRTRLGPQRG